MRTDVVPMGYYRLPVEEPPQRDHVQIVPYLARSGLVPRCQLLGLQGAWIAE